MIFWKNLFIGKLYWLGDLHLILTFPCCRITLLGWTSRQQFEETWMCLLGVLSSNPTEDSIPEEINAITHVTSLAVQAITSLLLQTLCTPILGDKNVSKLLHVSRDLQIDNSSTW